MKKHSCCILNSNDICNEKIKMSLLLFLLLWIEWHGFVNWLSLQYSVLVKDTLTVLIFM